MKLISSLASVSPRGRGPSGRPPESLHWLYLTIGAPCLYLLPFYYHPIHSHTDRSIYERSERFPDEPLDERVSKAASALGRSLVQTPAPESAESQILCGSADSGADVLRARNNRTVRNTGISASSDAPVAQSAAGE